MDALIWELLQVSQQLIPMMSEVDNLFYDQLDGLKYKRGGLLGIWGNGLVVD